MIFKFNVIDEETNPKKECGFCKTDLIKSDNSIKGICFDCWNRLQHEIIEMIPKCMDKTDSYINGEDIIISRMHSGGVRCNVPKSLIKNSPEGYGFGHKKGSALDLSLNILLLYEDIHFSLKHHELFNEQFIEPLKKDEGGRLSFEVIKSWIGIQKMRDKEKRKRSKGKE